MMRLMRGVTVVLVSASLSLAAVSCGGGGDGGPVAPKVPQSPPPPPPPQPGEHKITLVAAPSDAGGVLLELRGGTGMLRQLKGVTGGPQLSSILASDTLARFLVRGQLRVGRLATIDVADVTTTVTPRIISAAAGRAGNYRVHDPILYTITVAR
jgi:hypothetical protein